MHRHGNRSPRSQRPAAKSEPKTPRKPRRQKPYSFGTRNAAHVYEEQLSALR